MSPSATTAGVFQPLAQQRALFRCVLVSIALHALVLLALSWRGAPAPPAKALLVLTARLAPFAAPLHAPVQPPQPKIAPPPPPAPGSARRPASTKPAVTPAPAPQKAAPAEAVKAPQPELAPEATATSPAPVAAPVESSVAPQAPAGIPATEADAKSGNAPDAGTLDQYRLALIVATRRYKRYPAIALEKGWQGRVEVHMVIGANGMLASTSIKTGSGHETLDNQALDMLKKGKTMVPIPSNLRGREFSIDVPVIFKLDNPNS
jgi:periplasmic protein TonB